MLSFRPLAVVDMLEPEPQSGIHPMGALSVEEVVRLHSDVLYRVLRRSGVDEKDCADLCQETLLVYAMKQDRVRPSAERAFLIGIAVKKASEYRRSQKRKPTMDLDFEVQADGPSPFERLEAGRARALLDRLLSKMDEARRDVFILVELEGLSLPETAETLSIPVGTAASRIFRARADFEEIVLREKAEIDRKEKVR